MHRRATDNKVFYVGKGKGKRANWVYERNPRWTRTYKKHGLVVEIVFDGLSEQEAFELEIQTIAEMRYHFGDTLCNMTDGGDGASGYKATDEARKIKSELMKQRYNEDMKEKLAEGVRRYFSENPLACRIKNFSGKPWLHPNASHDIWTNADIIYEYYSRGLYKKSIFPDNPTFNVIEHFRKGFVPHESISWLNYAAMKGRCSLSEIPENSLLGRQDAVLLEKYFDIKKLVLEGNGYIKISKILGVKKSSIRTFVDKLREDFESYSSNIEFLFERRSIINGRN